MRGLLFVLFVAAAVCAEEAAQPAAGRSPRGASPADEYINKLEATYTATAAQVKNRESFLATVKLPFDEEKIRKRFHVAADKTFPTEPVRLRNVTQDTFEFYASRGIPVIVEDGFDRWKAKGLWSCEWFKKEFPDELVEGWTYGDEGNAKNRSKFRVKFKDLDVNEKHDITKDKITDPGNPTVMSWLWFPFRPGDVRAQRKPASMKIKQFYDVPYFIPKTRVNKVTVMNRFEAFFGSKNSGVQPHADDICQFIFSAQAAGQKKWRLTIPVDSQELAKLNDGMKVEAEDFKVLQNRMLEERSIFTFVMKPGDQLFFPPGMIHGTKVVSDECSMSLSLQFSDPSPVHYVKNWKDALTTEVQGASSCFHDYWNYWMFGVDELNSNGDTNDVECPGLFHQFDRNSDGFVDSDEMKAALLENPSYSHSLNDGDSFKDPENDVLSFIRLHDKNKDGKVDEAEYVEVCKLWGPSLKRGSNRFLRNQRMGREFDTLWQRLRGNEPDVTQEMWEDAFPRSQLWDAVTHFMDRNGDGVIDDEEFQEGTENLEDIDFQKASLEPLAVLLTGDPNGLDDVLAGRSDGTPREEDEEEEEEEEEGPPPAHDEL